MSDHRDRRQRAPSTQRNRQPILEVLKRVLVEPALVLEIASGTGEHALHFSSALSHLIWQPSDIDPDALASIEAWRVHEGPTNLRSPLEIDVLRPWPIESADAVMSSNMIHISPPEATSALLSGAAAILRTGGYLIVYGPFRENGSHTSESNEEFDAWLKSRDLAWGVRDLKEITEQALSRSLVHQETVVMPANNRMVVFRKA